MIGFYDLQDEIILPEEFTVVNFFESFEIEIKFNERSRINYNINLPDLDNLNEHNHYDSVDKII